ncbi:MAG TPA: hypothetical protein VKB38_22715 [Terracidiphilus sp.]|nr:hypothetical protein [Terracidiphilus sp.]
MEADWEFEVAADAPVIDQAWAGFVDLRNSPQRAMELPEAAQVSGIAETLKRLNSPASPVWTSKCDAWEPEEFDPDELDADHDKATRAIAIYIDLLPAEPDAWSTLHNIAGWCRSLCARLRERPLRGCRVDLVIRRSAGSAEQAELGITAYVVACGPDPAGAGKILSSALCALADAVAG